MNCKNCNAVMKVDVERKLFICPYCNATEPILTTSKEEIEELLHDAMKEAERESREMVAKAVETKRQEEMISDTAKSLKNVALYIGLTAALCVTVILGIFGVTTEGYTASGVVAFIQAALFFAAIVLHAASYEDKSRSVASTVCAIAATLCIIPWFVAMVSAKTPADEKHYLDDVYALDYDWPTEGYAAAVPHCGDKPDYAYVGDREFTATIRFADKEKFEDYVKTCKAEGFTLDAEESDTTYHAYNDLDNELEVEFYPEPSEIYIKMYKAIEWSEFTWPLQGDLKALPAPEADEIFIESMSTDYFKGYVNGFSRQKFLDYVQECMDAGFDGRYEGGNRFDAQKDKVRIILELKRDKVLEISIY